MTRTLTILLTALATGIATWWYRSQQLQQRPVLVSRGEVIYRNTPLAGVGE